MLCLYQTAESRISYNFDMYEESIVPERLPGGGGFSIKNLSLYSLYQEYRHVHNIFTATNKHYPLARYLGCKLRFYQSENADTVVTYSTTWPLQSNLQMYNSMQPSIQMMQKNKIIIPSKRTAKRKKPYITRFIRPPSQMQNKWYFQKSIAKTPLFMLRSTCCSLDHYYIGTRMKSTNISIISLNYSYFQNRKWGDRTYQYWCMRLGTIQQWLYTTHSTYNNALDIELQNLIPLTNTQDNLPGMSFEDYKKTHSNKTYDDYFQSNLEVRGNPFYKTYLDKTDPTFITELTWTQIKDKVKTTPTAKVRDLTHTFNEIEPTITIRYNPYKDTGDNNQCYFLNSKTGEHGWDPPPDSKLQNHNLPLWVLLFGFADFQKKLNVIHNIDTDYTLCIYSKFTYPVKNYLIPLSASFANGNSPYESFPNPVDSGAWYPSFQMQQEITNDICISGPGTPKIAPGDTIEAKVKYTFYFKWGGELPPMSTIDDPSEQDSYPIPNNFLQSTSLQNPTTNPAYHLYRFDERRQELTKAAAERIKKDWSFTDPSLLFAEPRFAEAPQKTSEETASEEEEETENLFQLLNLQRTKQLQLKQRIIQTLQKIQQLE